LATFFNQLNYSKSKNLVKSQSLLAFFVYKQKTKIAINSVIALDKPKILCYNTSEENEKRVNKQKRRLTASY